MELTEAELWSVSGGLNLQLAATPIPIPGYPLTNPGPMPSIGDTVGGALGSLLPF
jgi:hypothetical protein